MSPRVFNIASALSLLLCMGLLVLWASTQDHDVTLAHFTADGRMNDFLAGRGNLTVYTQPLVWRPAPGIQFHQWERPGFAATWHRRGGRLAWSASATLAYPAALFAVLPSLWCRRFLWRESRQEVAQRR
jgi:hypothetical protein